ncbi:hypothetical protein [Oribacterium sp. WCC10]|uniref:hypothetical protein n=1 Tax=Oribacterium sp. WCC10 TaxID=1855343 RepID=UPI0008E2804A|nr:hypothetical protein [Oribacterium sp. WCC10]SFG70551.1 hypothetical protein SAMN05216356_12052 [Oribacterium sp. WCC10]
MGEDIGSLFLKNDFRAGSATKSFLQDICMIADESTDESGLHVKGYFLAAYARSHKCIYGNFASTTFEYLRDSQFNTFKPEFVAFELLERDVFSCLATMLLQMAFGDRYTRLDPREKTRVITTMDLSPKEIENLVTVIDKGRNIASRPSIKVPISLINVENAILQGSSLYLQSQILLNFGILKRMLNGYKPHLCLF